MPVARMTLDVQVDGVAVFPPASAGKTFTLAFDEWSLESFEVAHAETATNIFPGKLTTGTVVFLHSTQTITYETAGSGTPRTITANTGIAMHWVDSFTVLTVSNASGSTATVTRLIVGT